MIQAPTFRVASSDISDTTLKPFGVTGKTLDVRGQQTVTLKLGRREFKHTFLVCQLPTDAAGLLGADFLEGAGAIISFESSELLITHRNRAPTSATTRPRNVRRLQSSRRVKRSTSPKPLSRRRGKGTNKPQPTPVVKHPPHRDDRGL